MSEKILVAYATKHGSTEGVAEAVGRAFAGEGASVEVKPVYEVEDLAGYRAVVLGSPLYAGKLRPEVVAFAAQHKEELLGMPTALFVVCLTMARPSEKSVQRVVKQTKPLVELLRPADVGLFAGAVDYAAIGFFNRMLMKFMKVPEGDFRNWEVIERWAAKVLAKLAKQ